MHTRATWPSFFKLMPKHAGHTQRGVCPGSAGTSVPAWNDAAHNLRCVFAHAPCAHVHLYVTHAPWKHPLRLLTPASSTFTHVHGCLCCMEIGELFREEVCLPLAIINFFQLCSSNAYWIWKNKGAFQMCMSVLSLMSPEYLPNVVQNARESYTFLTCQNHCAPLCARVWSCVRLWLLAGPCRAWMWGM